MFILTIWLEITINNKMANNMQCNKENALDKKIHIKLKTWEQASWERNHLIQHTNSHRSSVIWSHKLDKAKRCLKWTRQVLSDHHHQNTKKVQFLMFRSSSKLACYLHKVQEARVRKFWSLILMRLWCIPHSSHHRKRT